MAGVVETNFFDAKASNFSLPQGSLYTDIENVISRWSTGEAESPHAVPAEEFAKSVIGDIIGNKGNCGGKVWAVPFPFLMKWVVSLMPTFIMVNRPFLY